MDWVRGSAIGRGSSSAVHLAFCRSNQAPTILAVKSAPLSSAFLLQREEAILTELHGCPQIISCFGHDITTDTTGGGIDRLYNIFLEYAASGSISDSIHRAGGVLPEPTIRRHLRSILLCLRHIHAMGYVHCDIKPQNISIVEGEAKIADFGLAKKIVEESSMEIRGTPLYMAPESATRKEYKAAADIWAFGCTAVEMISGRSPWQCTEQSEMGIWGLLLRIGSDDEPPEIPPTMSEEGNDILSRLRSHLTPCFRKKALMDALRPVDIRNFYIESASFIQFSRRCRSPFVFFHTEFPGCIFRHSKHHMQLSPAERYSVLKLNADVIRPMQVGLTVSDGDTSTATWQFEIGDFDLRCHPHAPPSIALLQSSGINLTQNRQLGIPSTWLARLLLDAGIVGHYSKATWVAFHGCYDFAILFKSLFQLTTRMRVRLLETMEQFMALTKYFFGGRIYDVKCLMKSYDGLYGGLEKVTEKLDVKRAVGKTHQAGSDSLLTLPGVSEDEEDLFRPL